MKKKTTSENVESTEPTLNQNPPIDSVRVYQAVTFEKRSETFFSTRNINGTPGRKITLLDKFVSIETNNDHILVPYTNVSAIYLLSNLKKEQIQASEDAKTKKTGIAASEINRPR